MAEQRDERWNDLPLEAVPDRFSFAPGTERDGFDILWRECAGYDAAQVQRIVRRAGWKPSARTLARYLTQVGWTIRAAFRNRATIVALYAGDFLATHAEGRLNCLWVHPDYYKTKVPSRLLQLARLELPERASLAYVSAADKGMHAELEALGWTNTTDGLHDTPAPSRYEFRIAAAAGREYRKALGAGRAVRHPSAGDKQG